MHLEKKTIVETYVNRSAGSSSEKEDCCWEIIRSQKVAAGNYYDRSKLLPDSILVEYCRTKLSEQVAILVCDPLGRARYE